MEQEIGRVADATGLSQVEPASSLAPTGFDPSRIRRIALLIRDSQALQEGERVEVDFTAFCDLLLAAHDWAEVLERIASTDYWDGNGEDLISWVALGYIEDGRGKRLYSQWPPIGS